MTKDATMSPDERADRIITAFWDYFSKSEHGFIVKDSIARHIREAQAATREEGALMLESIGHDKSAALIRQLGKDSCDED